MAGRIMFKTIVNLVVLLVFVISALIDLICFKTFDRVSGLGLLLEGCMIGMTLTQLLFPLKEQADEIRKPDIKTKAILMTLVAIGSGIALWEFRKMGMETYGSLFIAVPLCLGVVAFSVWSIVVKKNVSE